LLTNTKKLYEWTVKVTDEKYASNFFKECHINRKKYTKEKEKQKLQEHIKAQIENLSKLKEEIIARYEKNIDKETAAKFKNVKESIVFYTSPSYIIESVNNILMGTTTKSKNIKKSKLHNPQFVLESVADIIEKEREYKREDRKNNSC